MRGTQRPYCGKFPPPTTAAPSAPPRRNSRFVYCPGSFRVKSAVGDFLCDLCDSPAILAVKSFPSACDRRPSRPRPVPFCISCALPVDIPPACSPGFSLPAVPPPENYRDPAVESPVPHPSLHPCQSGKIATAFFLNCTKNTELTSAYFTRTVTFALTKTNRS